MDEFTHMLEGLDFDDGCFEILHPTSEEDFQEALEMMNVEDSIRRFEFDPDIQWVVDLVLGTAFNRFH